MTIVSLTGARKAFGATEVLKGIDLATEDGEFLVLVGPSGCGKSTRCALSPASRTSTAAS